MDPYTADMGELETLLAKDDVLHDVFFLANEDCLLVTFIFFPVLALTIRLFRFLSCVPPSIGPRFADLAEDKHATQTIVA